MHAPFGSARGQNFTSNAVWFPATAASPDRVLYCPVSGAPTFTDRDDIEEEAFRRRAQLFLATDLTFHIGRILLEVGIRLGAAVKGVGIPFHICIIG